MLSLWEGKGRARRAPACCAFCTCGPTLWAARGRRSHQRDRNSCRQRKKGKAEEAVKLMERAWRPDGAPELAEHRQGRRGWRLKCTEAASEEETCPMGVEGSSAINHRTGFSAFLLVKGQARKREQAAREPIKARRLWTSGCQAVSGLVTLCRLKGLALAASAALSDLPTKSAGHHTSITPIFRARTGGQERLKSSAKVTQASSQGHSSPDAPISSCQYLSPPSTTETTAVQPGPAS